MYHAGLARVNRGRGAEFRVCVAGTAAQVFFSFTRFTRMTANEAVADTPVSVIR